MAPVIAPVAAEDAEAGEQDNLLAQPAGPRGDGGQAKSERRKQCAIPPKALVGVGLLVLMGVCLHFFSAERLHNIMVAMQGNPLSSAMLFFVFNALGVVLMLPGMVLSIGAGAVFGFTRGAVLSWAATSAGTLLAFLLGRYLLAETVAGYVSERFPSYPAIEAALAKEGWKLVLLLKVAPMSPWNVLNYVMSATPLSTAAFALPSAVAAVPYVCLFSYMGSVSNDVMASIKGGHDMHISMTWILLSPLLLLFSAIGVVVLTRRIMHSSMQAALIATELELPVSVANAIIHSCSMDSEAIVSSENGSRFEPQWMPAHGTGAHAMTSVSMHRGPRLSAPA